MPQPYFVPVKPICSRMTQSKGVLGSTSTVRALPLTVNFAMRISLNLSNLGDGRCIFLITYKILSELLKKTLGFLPSEDAITISAEIFFAG
jgi:hypothetical protein